MEWQKCLKVIVVTVPLAVLFNCTPGKKYLDSAKIPGKNSCHESQVSIESFIRFLAGPPIVESQHVCDGRTDGKNAPLKTKSGRESEGEGEGDRQ